MSRAIEQSFDDRRKKNVCWRDENMHRFEKLLLTVPAVWFEEEKIIDFYTLLHSYFVLKNGSLKIKRRKNVITFCVV